MKKETYESLDHEFVIEIPDSVKEFDTLAKKEGACLVAAIDHEVYHSTLGTIREAFCDLVEEVTGVKRREIGTGKFEGEGADKTEVTVWEKPSVYLTRAAAEKNLKGPRPFADIAKRLSAGGDKVIAFDPSVAPRTGKGPAIAKMYLSQAEAIIDGKPHEDFGNKVISVTKLNAAFKKDLGEAQQYVAGADRAANILGMAKLLKARRDALAAAAQRKEAEALAA